MSQDIHAMISPMERTSIIGSVGFTKRLCNRGGGWKSEFRREPEGGLYFSTQQEPAAMAGLAAGRKMAQK